MASYKDLFEVYRQAWREDWEASSALTEKAKTYLLVIGLVFGYSIFNLNAFLGLIENRTPQGTLFADCSLVAIKILFSLYLLSFSVALRHKKGLRSDFQIIHSRDEGKNLNI